MGRKFRSHSHDTEPAPHTTVAEPVLFSAASTTAVNAPVEAVWAYVVDPATNTSDPVVVSSAWLGEARGKGAMQILVTRLPNGDRRVSAVEVTEFRAGQFAAYRTVTPDAAITPSGGSVELRTTAGTVQVIHKTWIAYPGPMADAHAAAQNQDLQHHVDQASARLAQHFSSGSCLPIDLSGDMH